MKEAVLSELWRYYRGLEVAGAIEAGDFEDHYQDLKDGKQTVAETVYRVTMRYNHTNGNGDIAMKFLQLLTEEDRPIEQYAYDNCWNG